LPMPLPPPVTRATLPFDAISGSSVNFSGAQNISFDRQVTRVGAKIAPETGRAPCE
jgi:hypothetical protein